MTVSEKILRLLSEHTMTYKGVAVNILGFPVANKYRKQTVKNAIYYFRKEGYIENKNGYAEVTKKGRAYLKKINSDFKSFISPFADKSLKNLLVMYDIPEDKKTEREWFRRHLRSFGYVMIQRSVWVGPSPLPKEFLSYVKSIGLKDSIKTFKLAKSYFTQN